MVALNVPIDLRDQARRARRLALAATLSAADIQRLLVYAEELENRAVAEDARRQPLDPNQIAASRL
jgi:hypothetical protein